MSSKKYLHLLKEALRAKTQLTTNIDTQQSTALDLLKKTETTQKPIIKEVAKVTEELKKISQTSQPQTNTPKLTTPQFNNTIQQTSGQSYNLIKTGKKIHSPSQNKDFDEWKFNSTTTSNSGRFVIFENSGIDYIWDLNHEHGSVPITDGLREILFNNARELDKINDDDIEGWKYLLNNAGLGVSYHFTKLWKILKNKPEQKPIIEEIGEPTGDGLFTLPSDPIRLREELELQKGAKNAGHKTTFNYANAIMKELLSQKQMTVKEYRDILKNVFAV